MPIRNLSDLRQWAGEGWENASDADLVSAYAKQANMPLVEVANAVGYDAGTGGVTAKRLTSSFSNYAGSLQGVGEAVTGAMGLTGAEEYLAEKRRANEVQAEVASARAQKMGAIESYKDVNTVGKAFNYAGGLAAQSLPYAAEAMVGAGEARLAMRGTRAALEEAQAAYKTAAAAGNATEAARAAQAIKQAEHSLEVGQNVGIVAQSYPSSLGDILGNQREQSGKTDLGSAALLAAPYAALNIFEPQAALAKGGAFRNTINLLDRPGGIGGAAARLGATATVQGLKEGVSETSQEMLNQAGRMAVDDKAQFFSQDAVERYKESFVGGAVLGGAMGGIAGGWRRSEGFQAGNDVQQAFTQPQTSGTPTSNQTPPAPPAAGATVVPPVTPNAPAGGAAALAPGQVAGTTTTADQTAGATAAPITPPVVSGGTSAIAQASANQTQAGFVAQQQQAIQDQREKVIDQFGLRGEKDGSGQFFNRPILSVDAINKVADALGPIAAKLDKEDAAVMNAILQADASLDKGITDPLKKNKIVKFDFDPNNIVKSVQKGVEAVLSIANKFQIGHVASVAEAAENLNTLSQSAKGTNLVHINAIHEALTGKDTDGYIASQAPKPTKGKPNGQQQQQLPVQTTPGLGAVSEQGRAGQVDGGLTGLLQPGAVQPVGTGTVAGTTPNQQAGQPSGEGVRPSASVAADNGSDVYTPQVNLTARAPETNELLRQVFGGEPTSGELVTPTAIGGLTRVAKPQVTGVSNETGTTQGAVGGGQASSQSSQANQPGVDRQPVQTGAAGAAPIIGARQYDPRLQYYGTDLSHISSPRRIEIIQQLLDAALTPKYLRDNTIPAETRGEIVRLALIEQFSMKDIAEFTKLKLDAVSKQLQRMGVALKDGEFQVVRPAFAESLVAHAEAFRSAEFPDGVGINELKGLYSTRYEGQEQAAGDLAEELQNGEQEGDRSKLLAEERFGGESGEGQSMGTISSAGGSQGAVESEESTALNKIEKLQKQLDETPDTDTEGKANLAKQLATAWNVYEKEQKTRAKTGETAVKYKEEKATELGKPEGEEDAVQVESADEGDVREPTGGGEEVGKANAEPKKPARTRKAKAESKPASEATGKKPWEGVTRKTRGTVELVDTSLFDGVSQRNKADTSTPEYAALKASIAETGIVDPITITTNSLGKPEVFEGNHRLQAARELGIKQVPVVLHSRTNQSESHPVVGVKPSSLLAKEEIKTPKEQWDALADKFPQMPPYATLNKDEKIRWDDVAERGVANLAAANTILSTTVVAEPAETVEAKPAEQVTATDEQKKTAQALADSKGGSVAWQKGDLALIRGYSILTGQPVYAAAKGSSITKVDIESFTGSAFTAEEKAELVDAKQRLEKQDAEKHATDPFVKFDSAGLAVSQSVSPQLTGVVSGWKQMLGIKANVYVTTIEDAKANKDKLTGPQRAVSSAALDPNEGGSMRKLPDGSYYVAFVKGTSTAKMLETIAHELGHVHEREAFANADPATQKAIKAEFEKWKASTKGKTAKEVVESLRARATGRSTTGFEGKTSEDMSAYWKSFSEWYADQVSRWATTSEKPLTVVEKFFARLGAALKKFYYSLKGQKYLPSETMKQFLDKIADGATIIDSKSAEAVDNEFASQAMFVGAKGVETRGMTDKQTTNMVTAKIMDAQGELREDIWYTTGWLRGVDEQWRTEVSDRDAKMTLDKVAPGGKVEMNKPYRLGDVLSHLPLYRLYPELADYTVRFDPSLQPDNAAYDPDQKTIWMPLSKPDNVSSLLHEVQHAIQDIEGFGRGGSPKAMDVLNVNAAEKFYKLSVSRTQTDAQDVAVLNYYRAVQALHVATIAYNNANTAYYATVENGNPSAKAKEEKERLAKVASGARFQAGQAFDNMLKELDTTKERVQQEMYLLISGEVEARDVQARREYNNELRRQVVPGEGEGLPYDMQLVFDKNTGTYKSIGKTLDARAQEQVEKLPAKWQPAARTITTTLLHTVKKSALASMITEDVINAASKYMKSAQDYLTAQYARGATQTKHEQKIDKILQQFDKLPENLKGTGKGSVNEYIHDSTRQGLWGYYPDARLVGTSMAQIDPEFKRRFNAFPKAAQDLIKATFEQGHDSLAAKQKAVSDAIDREYADRIAAVQGDAELTKKFEKEKNLRLAREAKLLGLDSSKPYAYLGRYGDYVVVGKSAEYKFHEEQAKSGPVVKGEYLYGADSRKWLEDNRSNPAHYVVQFAETLGEADQIAATLNATGNYDIAESFEKEPYSTQGGELFTAVSRLRNLYDRESEGADPQAAAAISNLLGDLYLHTVSEASARKSEFQRLNISGADKDMMRNLATRGRADAHFLAALEHNDAISDSLSSMRKERDRNRREAGPYFNELLQRHANSMEYKTPGVLSTALQRMSTVWYLSTNPAFYLQQILQTGAISLPYMAGRLGYFRSARAIKRAYGDMATLVKGVGLTDHIDFAQAPADVRDMLKTLVGMGKIDIGIDYEARTRAGETGVVASVMNKLQGVNNRIEAINRATAAIAAYRGYLERYKNNDTAAATKYAADVVSNTHGSYDAFNTPRIMSGPAGKVLLQFKRFQIIQISMLAKLLNTAFKGASAEEKTVARHSLAFITGQMAVLGGMMAVPFAQQAAWMLSKIFGDPDEPDDWEYKLRRMVNDKAVADLLITGVPGALGVDMSSKLGMGNVFSIFPYTDVDLASRSGAEKVIVAAMGASANLGLKFADALGLMAQGQYYKGLEQMLPNGIANLMKGARFAAEGITMRNGDVVLKPDEVSMMDAAFQAVGMPTNTITDRQFTQKVVKEFDKYYTQRTTEVKGDYVKASRSGDSAAMGDAIDDWVKLQESRIANGYKRQPYSELYRAPMEALKRERNTAGGVEFGKSNRRLVESLSQ